MICRLTPFDVIRLSVVADEPIIENEGDGDEGNGDEGDSPGGTGRLKRRMTRNLSLTLSVSSVTPGPGDEAEGGRALSQSVRKHSLSVRSRGTRFSTGSAGNSGMSPAGLQETVQQTLGPSQVGD